MKFAKLICSKSPILLGQIRQICSSKMIRANIPHSRAREVIALESTVITHGMPYPDNLETARTLEQIVSSAGWFPATVGVVRGQLHVGLDANQLSELATANDTLKLAQRDLPYAVANSITGGTTVSATAWLASRLGVTLFATGGIGGVHRGSAWDVSADLDTLSRTPIAVVCAGVKSILDVPRTLEYLETKGVPVYTIGPPGSDFPGFFTRSSGMPSPRIVPGPKEAAELILAHQPMGLSSGMIFAVPLPESAQAVGDEIEAAITDALAEAESRGITGSAVTPFVLEAVRQRTGGKSLLVNRALIENNVRMATEIMNHLHEKPAGGNFESREEVSCGEKSDSRSGTGKGFAPHIAGGLADENSKSLCSKSDPNGFEVVVTGGIILDSYVRPSVPICEDGSTYSGELHFSVGGVGRNTADALTRLGVKTALLSAIGNDLQGNLVSTNSSHVDFRFVKTVQDLATATYAGVLSEKGSLRFGIHSGDIMTHIRPDSFQDFFSNLITNSDSSDIPRLFFMDGNIPEAMVRFHADFLSKLCLEKRKNGMTKNGFLCADRILWFDPTDKAKASLPIKAGMWQSVTHVSPNWMEFREIFVALGCGHPPPLDHSSLQTDQIQPYLEAVFEKSPDLQLLILTLDKAGVYFCQRFPPPGGQVDFVFRKPKSAVLVNPSGAGDCLNAAYIAGLVRGKAQGECMDIALEAARLSLENVKTVPETLQSLMCHF